MCVVGANDLTQSQECLTQRSLGLPSTAFILVSSTPAVLLLVYFLSSTSTHLCRRPHAAMLLTFIPFILGWGVASGLTIDPVTNVYLCDGALTDVTYHWTGGTPPYTLSVPSPMSIFRWSRVTVLLTLYSDRW